MTSVASVVVVAAGTFLCYFELLRPGMFVPGALGLGVWCSGAWAIAHNHPRPLGLLLAATAAVCFLAGVFAPLRGVLALAGIALATASGVYLFAQPSLTVSLLVSLVGVLTAALSNSAARARRNKRIDLD